MICKLILLSIVVALSLAETAETREKRHIFPGYGMMGGYHGYGMMGGYHGYGMMGLYPGMLYGRKKRDAPELSRKKRQLMMAPFGMYGGMMGMYPGMMYGHGFYGGGMLYGKRR